MPKADRLTTMPKSNVSSSISVLAEQLLALWDADDGAGSERLKLSQKERELAERSAKETSSQLYEWREAVELLISFSPATTLHEALVQLAIASDTANDVAELSEQAEPNEGLISSKRLMLDRLLDSIICVLSKSVPMDPTCASIVKIYSGNFEVNQPWSAVVSDWAEAGRKARKPGSAGA